MSEDTRNALNALLYNTGSASRRLMMVLATNRAEVRVYQAGVEVASTYLYVMAYCYIMIRRCLVFGVRTRDIETHRTAPTLGPFLHGAAAPRGESFQRRNQVCA